MSKPRPKRHKPKSAPILFGHQTAINAQLAKNRRLEEERRADSAIDIHRALYRNQKPPLEVAYGLADVPRAKWCTLHEPGQPSMLREAFAAFLDRVLDDKDAQQARKETRKRVFGEVLRRLRAEKPVQFDVLRRYFLNSESGRSIRERNKWSGTTFMKHLTEAVTLVNLWFDQAAPPTLEAEVEAS